MAGYFLGEKNRGHFASNEELVGSLEPCFRPFFSADAVGPGCPVVRRLWESLSSALSHVDIC